MDPDDRISTAFVLIFVLLAIGTVSYNYLEGWSYVDSLYFTAMTITTVGYGDLVPTSPISKLFTVGFAFGGVSIALVILVSLGRDYYNRERRAFHYRIQKYLEARSSRSKKNKRTKKRRKRKVKTSKRKRPFGFFK